MKMVQAVFIILGIASLIFSVGWFGCEGTKDGWWHEPTGGITVKKGTYLYKYALKEIHVTHTNGITDTTYVYRVLCQEMD